jgi:hypothetical protein
MSSAAYYLSEAARCRDLAAKSRDADAMKRWLRMAVEYEQLADSMVGCPSVPSTSGSSQIQRQPMQQQQTQAGPENEK